ncbi:hypothetical protein [Oceanibacterium hippocampi]|nr:hypothetical protein [Oceanibacterium hippocampi]
MRGLTTLKRSLGDPIPSGSVIDIKLAADSDHPFTVELATDGAGRLTICPYRGELAAALLVYCRQVRIPIPVNARKSVDVKNGRVVLRIEID